MIAATESATRPHHARTDTTIAVLDNTCNTAYITTKLLRRAGYAADFIEEPNMPFNHQPVWEDVDFSFVAAEVAPHPRGDRYWRETERTFGWEAPAWVRRPRWDLRRDLPLALGLPRTLASVMPWALVPLGLAVTLPTVPIVRELGKYDVALVLGPSAAAGYLSRRPYAVITMGWEIFTLPFMTGSRNLVHRARAWLQRAALGGTERILGMPSTDLEYLRRLGIEHLLQPFPVPVDVDGYEGIDPGTRASALGDELADRMADKTVYFHPSRISFAEKGTDLLLRAFAEVLRSGVPAFLLLLEWGVDVERARTLVSELGIGDDMCILPSVLSKKRLIRTFRHIDVAVVQFAPAGYCTLDREALACGKPVISSYDSSAPQPHPADDPAPIISARTVDDIRDAMLRLTDPELRARLGEEGTRWARRNHQEAALKAIAELVHEIVP